MKILIIDDNEEDRLLIEAKINKAWPNCKTSLAESGEKGLELVKKINPNITIIDTNLPGIDGFQVCKTIKNQHGQAVKIVMVTGHIDAVDAVKAKRSGADDYAVKTSDEAYLIKIISKLI